jgi:hypothetical protein
MSQVYTGTFTVVLPAIEGTITDAKGHPVPGVLLQSTGFSQAVSDGNGHYKVGFVPGSFFTVTPAKDGLMFVPGSMSYSSVIAAITNQNYVAVDTIAPPVTATVQGANLVIEWHGYSGVRYQLLYSTNLVNWLPCGVVATGSNSLVQMPVPVDTQPMKFFRVRADN